MNRAQSIYVMQSRARGACKVGVSVDPRARASQLRKRYPDTRLRVYREAPPAHHGLDVEAVAHAILRKRRIGASEWFRVKPSAAWRAVNLAAAMLWLGGHGIQPHRDRVIRLGRAAGAVWQWN